MTADGAMIRTRRRRELDVLTTLIVFGLAFFHTASIFSGHQLITNKMQSQLTTVLASLVVSLEFIWIMPVMMLVAGIAVWHSLERRSAKRFLRERLLRLGVPFLTGLILVNPPQVYYYLKAATGLSTGFMAFLPRYWNIRFSLLSFPYFLEPAGSEETFSVIHLWFLVFLLVYTLLLLPLFLYLKRSSGNRLAMRVSGFLSRRFAVFLWAFPIALLEAFLGAIWPSGWNRWIWPFIILFGYLSAGDDRLTAALVRHRILALVVGLIGFFGFFTGTGILTGLGIDPWTGGEGPAIILRFIKGSASWCLTVAVVGIATRIGQRRAAMPHTTGRPTFWSRLAAYGREAQLPFYVLHQTPIIIIGYYIVGQDWSALAKFWIIFLGSLISTLLVYELLVRRIGVLRLLFGMKPKTRGESGNRR
jgi:glucan biosynthesis protein C